MLDATTRRFRTGWRWCSAFFATLAVWEVFRRGRGSRRLREYGFLLFATTTAVAFAVVHEHLTAVSPEYFLAGKGLSSDPRPYRIAVSLLAAKSSYWVGLVIGTALLVANNPSARRPQLGYPVLVRLSVLPFVGAAVGAAAIGAASRGLDLGLGTAVTLAGPNAANRFILVWGIHAGSYIGALDGAVGAVVAVVIRRRRVAVPAGEDGVGSPPVNPS